MPELFDPYLIKTFKKDKTNLEKSKVPIITLSASYKEDLKKIYNFPDNDTTPDIVFSRAHYSMALGVAMQAWDHKVDPNKAWIVDPTNYVSHKNWSSITFTEKVGKILARHSYLKKIKDFIDKFGRSKLPILPSITPPLLHLTENIHQPILSFHIAVGNILAGLGKQVVQVVTDPHVRDEYVKYANQENIKFCVFDEKTKTDFLEKAKLLGIEADENRVIVTGPPVDPRITQQRKHKYAYRSGKLNLCITTGGLGTNKYEILKVLDQLLPTMRKKDYPYRVVFYAGTQKDIYQESLLLAKKHRVKVDRNKDKKGKLRILYHPQVVDANELLINYAFGWADGFITKPSGDMAYDAVASGSFLLTLTEWGEWEERIREIFEQKNISRKLLMDSVVAQLEVLAKTNHHSQSWIERAMHNALTIDKLFLNGAKKILNNVT